MGGLLHFSSLAFTPGSRFIVVCAAQRDHLVCFRRLPYFSSSICNLAHLLRQVVSSHVPFSFMSVCNSRLVCNVLICFASPSLFALSENMDALSRTRNRLPNTAEK